MTMRRSPDKKSNAYEKIVLLNFYPLKNILIIFGTMDSARVGVFHDLKKECKSSNTL
jgi:hypothetical protein